MGINAQIELEFCFIGWYLFLPVSYPIEFLTNVQINSTSSISSMLVTIIEALTLEITSMNMQDLIVTPACMFVFLSFFPFRLLFCLTGTSYVSDY